MPKGTPRDWTLDDLRRIAERRDYSAQVLADEFGVSYSTIYSVKKQINDAGSPEALYALMQERARRRYGPSGYTTRVPKAPETLAYALQKVYLLREGAAGRGGSSPQVTVTIPAAIARPFMAAHGIEVMYELREDGILIKPAPKLSGVEMPSWIREATDEC